VDVTKYFILGKKLTQKPLVFDIAFFMYGLVSLLGFLGYFYKPKHHGQKAKNVEFVIPSTADERTINSLKECVGHLQKNFQGYKIWVVIDEGKEIRLDGATVIIVPDGFQGKKCKGRALEYFRQKYVETDKWYVFLDDDSYPLDDNFLHEISYYEQKGYVASNGILLPRRGKSTLCYILDHLRYWDDLFIFRLNTGALHTPYIGFHGELLIVKGSILKKHCFSINSIVEDFVFAQDLVKSHYKTWQSRTRVSIKSPNKLEDFWRQRARWIKGILLELHRCRITSTLFILFRVIGGITSSIIFFPLWFLFPATTFLRFFGVFGTVYYITSYIYGILQSKNYRYFFVLPIAGVFEHISLFYIPKTRGFTVIDKN
jgi:cellulose synthase/poly-beta-1,6-N-acetylglucosamine synthase-like glycosyltransferase